jgi:hypothetical protein
MADRSRVVVGREVAYFPTTAEAAGGGGGTVWPAIVSDVQRAGTVNLGVTKADGSHLAKLAVSRGQTGGTFDLRGIAGRA